MPAAEVFSYGEVLDEVRGLRWGARTPVSVLLPGRHQSRRRGTSAEFTEYRPYRQGDPPQKIDWKVFARTDRPYIRLSNDHAVLPTVFVLDASASMAFPERMHDKHARARSLLVGLASIAHNSGDPVGVVVADGTGARTFAPRARTGVVQEIARTIVSVAPSGCARIADALTAASRLAERVIVISDMLGDLDDTLAAARAERAKGTELYAVHVIAAEELDPPRSAVVADPEDASVRRMLSDESRGEYERSFAVWRETVASVWRSSGVSYHQSVTGTTLLTDIRSIVGRPR